MATVTKEQKNPQNPFFNYGTYINNLNFNRTADGKDNVPKDHRINPNLASKLRQVLLDLLKITCNTGGKILHIGMKILDFIIEALKIFPRAAAGLLIIGILFHMNGSIPLIGNFLNAMLVPFAVTIVSVGLIQDVIGCDIFNKIFNTFVKGLAI